MFSRTAPSKSASYFHEPPHYFVSLLSLFLLFESSATLGDDSKSADLKVTYSLRQSPGGTKITYSLPYLDKVSHGETVPGYYHAEISAAFPELSAQVSNNLGRTVVLTKAHFLVQTSSADEQAIIVVEENWYAVNKIILVNQGWLGTQSGKLEILGWGRFNHEASHCQEASFPYGQHVAYPVAAIDRYSDIDVSAAVPQEFRSHQPGVSILGKKFQMPSDTAACVLGRFTYVDARGRQGVLNFHSGVSLQMPGPGAAMPPTAFYDLPLKCGDSGQDLTVPISQSMKPGEADHFVFKAWADRSCHFTLNVSFETTEHTRISAGDMDLSIFVPRSTSERVAPSVLRDKDSPGPIPHLFAPSQNVTD